MDIILQHELSHGHTVEIGAASWNPEDTSVRNRYTAAHAGLNPHCSSEVPVNDLVPMLQFVAQHNVLSIVQCAEIMESLAASIRRQTGDPEPID